MALKTIVVSKNGIEKGSHGTFVYEGKYFGHRVAVKSVPWALEDAAVGEIAYLIISNNHRNIVHYYGFKCASGSIDLALELCYCTLYDLIMNKYTESSQLWTRCGYPSSALTKLMRDMVAGLVRLHELGIIHLDLKPHDVLITKGDALCAKLGDLKPHDVLITKGETICAKLSDLGGSRRLALGASSLEPDATGSGSKGWQSPEQIFGRHQTPASDMYSLGRIFFFISTRGSYQFRDIAYEHEKIEMNNDMWLLEYFPEAMDLCLRLLNPDPTLRPKASEIRPHPLFWDSDKRMSFIEKASDHADLERQRGKEDSVLIALESEGRVDFTAGRWNVEIDPVFLDHMSQWRVYKYDRVDDLLRIIRNTKSHYQSGFPKEVQNLLGSWPEGVDDYFRRRFPKLLMIVYDIMYRLCKEEWFLEFMQ